MKLLRGTTRLASLLLFTALQMTIFGVGKLLVSHKPKAELRWRNLNFRTWSRFVVRLLNIKLVVTNRPPSGSFLLVSNHLSYIDVVVLASQVDCTFIAKSEVSSWPLIGPLAQWFGTIFINRSQRRDLLSVINKMKHSLAEGLGVVLFAEGTSTNGRKVTPFKSSLLEFASRHQLPVHYASVSYTTYGEDPSADVSICWWGTMTFADHFFQMMQLRGFEAQLRFGVEPIVSSDRRMLTSRLWQAINEQFIPVVAN